MASRPAPPLARRAILGIVWLFAVMAAVLMVSAGSVAFWQGWAFLVTFIGGSTVLTLYLAVRDPALLQRRMRGGPGAEREPSQRRIQTITGLLFAGLLIVPGLDHRFGWSHMPLPLVVLGHLLVLIGFVGWVFVFRENSFASGIIEVAPDQRVIDTGVYALVRHPMYAAGLLLFIGVPLALGSYWGLVVFFLMTPALIARLIEEERFLDRNLPGYPDYRQHVRWRLIPGVW